MKNKRILGAFLMMLCCIFMFSVQAFADNNLVPYNPGGTSAVTESGGTPTGGASGQGNSSEPTDYAGQLFQETQIMENETVNATVGAIAKVASALITLVLGAITSILSIIMVIDICCLLIKPLTGLLAKLPIQLFSDEVSAITGIQYTGNTEGGGGATVEKVDLKGKPAFFYYIEKKAVTIIPAIIILILLGTGLLFKGVFFVSNHVVSWFAGLF